MQAIDKTGTEPRNVRPTKLTLQSIARLRPAAARYEVADTEIPGFRLRVAPSGVMTYALMYRTPQGRRARYTIGKHGAITPAQARKGAADKLAEIQLGADPQQAKKQARQQFEMPTLRQFIEGDYREWATAHRKSGAQTVSRIQGAFAAEFGDTRLDKLTAWNLEKWRSKRLKGGVQNATINRDLTALQGALTKACMWGKLEASPFADIKPLDEDDTPHVRYLDRAEEKRLRNALDAREERLRVERDTANAWRRARGYEELVDRRAVVHADYLKPMVLLSMNTGMRRGELFQLTWQCVDLINAQIKVMGKTAKKLKSRYIPLNREAFDVLQSWRAQQDKHDGLVFQGKDGNPFNNVKKAWAGLLKQAQIAAFRWHDLRHHFASKLVMAGVDLNTVRELLGHSDIKMTLRYAHLAPEHKAAAVARLNASVPEITQAQVG